MAKRGRAKEVYEYVESRKRKGRKDVAVKVQVPEETPFMFKSEQRGKFAADLKKSKAEDKKKSYKTARDMREAEAPKKTSKRVRHM